MVENLIDDDRRENVYGLMLFLNMLIETGDGVDYTGADFCGWCTVVGFQSVEVIPLGGLANAGVAYTYLLGRRSAAAAVNAASY